MLQPADCKPGIEVIAVKNYPYMLPALSIGSVYTIDVFLASPFDLICDFQQIVRGPFVCVNEIQTRACRKCNQQVDAIYFLDQFNIRDVKKFEDLFNLSKNKVLEPA